MTQPPKKRPGPKPSGRPRKIPIAFSVLPDEWEWLQALPNRSEWLRKCIETARTSSNNSSEPQNEAS